MIAADRWYSIKRKYSIEFLTLLPIVPLCIDLFTPFLIWKNFIPAVVRWGSHFAIALMILVTFTRMLGFNRIPRAIWLIFAISILWSYIAIGHGQGIPATIWGVWLLFQFPFVCLFIYLQPDLPKQLPSISVSLA